MKQEKTKNPDILLIDPPWYRFFNQRSSTKPLGLTYLSASLKKNGFSALVYKPDLSPAGDTIDALSTTRRYQSYLLRIDNLGDSAWREIKGTILKYLPAAVGITVVSAKYRSALNLARLIKKIDPGIKIIAGGPHSTINPAEVLETKLFDFVVRGEGEDTLVELMRYLIRGQGNLADIKGVSYYKNGEIINNPQRQLIKNLDSLPFPDNDSIINKKYMLPDDYAYLMASRGCPYRCIFCAAYKTWGRKVRTRSAIDLINEIKEIKDRYQPVYFHFQDDSFTINKKFIDSFCFRLKKESIKIRWSCETRADLISDEIVKKMKKSGCYKVILGAESGNDFILKKIKKDVNCGQIEKAVKICKKNGLETSLFFMIGFPWETAKEIKETVNFMEKLDPQYAVFSVATPYPATELYRVCKQKGLLPDDTDWSRFFHQSPDMFLSDKLGRDEIRKIMEEVEEKFIRHNRKKHRIKLLNPLRLLREIKRFYRQPQEFLNKAKYILKI
ncbi:MAG: radical SAM protein [Candidatus Omnitrophica bacterium]|nr:radical SAM protein [Candidatus Omnitrophota bacterium]